ncbi:hypothetical protein FRB97_009147 [Tulasnella sp. 331]|nr:hypothetical protein FRB97_009147 [Tulasnella sp. 331]KAG8873427.1 hypothetical protein FRB98_009021 [Tulasnella sp. 332]
MALQLAATKPATNDSLPTEQILLQDPISEGVEPPLSPDKALGSNLSPKRSSVATPYNTPLPLSPTSPTGVSLIQTGPLIDGEYREGIPEITSSSAEPKDDRITKGELLPRELFWAARHDFLKRSGYLLRPRYRPDWKASWLPERSGDSSPEDAIVLSRGHLADAVRISDDKTVYLKYSFKSSSELDIGRFLASEDLLEDPRNHAMPLLDFLEDEIDPEIVILVFPLLRRMDKPRPASVRECVYFIEQTLEVRLGVSSRTPGGTQASALQCHRNPKFTNFPHRDCAWANIMMDARRMFPGGWHPQKYGCLPDGQVLKNPNPSRTAAGGVRYYFIDFGISTRGQDKTLGILGQERAPELSTKVPYDPYKLDVYILGMMYQNFLMEGRPFGLDFVIPLIEYMTPETPDDRPTAAEALERFKTIQATLTTSQLSQRLRPLKGESTASRIVKDAYYRICDRWWTFWSKPKQTPLP